MPSHRRASCGSSLGWLPGHVSSLATELEPGVPALHVPVRESPPFSQSNVLRQAGRLYVERCWPWLSGLRLDGWLDRKSGERGSRTIVGAVTDLSGFAAYHEPGLRPDGLEPMNPT